MHEVESKMCERDAPQSAKKGESKPYENNKESLSLTEENYDAKRR